MKITMFALVIMLSAYALSGCAHKQVVTRKIIKLANADSGDWSASFNTGFKSIEDFTVVKVDLFSARFKRWKDLGDYCIYFHAVGDQRVKTISRWRFSVDGETIVYNRLANIAPQGFYERDRVESVLWNYIWDGTFGFSLEEAKALLGKNVVLTLYGDGGESMPFRFKFPDQLVEETNYRFYNGFTGKTR